MEAEIYTNRYGSKQTFTPDKNGNIEWRADFEYAREGYGGEPDEILMVDPAGGAYLTRGMPSTMAHTKMKGRFIDKFVWKRDKHDFYCLIILTDEKKPTWG